jgi:hypothetical protein
LKPLDKAFSNFPGKNSVDRAENDWQKAFGGWGRGSKFGVWAMALL